MKRFMRKILLSAICLTTVTTASAYDFQYDGLCYNIVSEDDRTVEVTYLRIIYGNDSHSYDGNYVSGELTIPERVIDSGKTYKVKRIGEYAFYGCSRLTSVVIPNSVTLIDFGAFLDCSSLTSVVIPNSVTSICEDAFINCSSLTSVAIPNSVTSIDNDAFWDCSSLTSVVIPNSVTSIGENVFYGCSSLTEIVVDDDNQYYTSIDGVLYSKDCSLLHTCPGAKTSVEIPNSVTSIGNGAFGDCSNLTSIAIPNSVTSIGYDAFWDCSSLTSIVIGSSVTSIGDDAFYGCDNLKEVYCMMETPVETEATFEDDVLINAVLYVPTGTKNEYEKVDPWRNFFNIEEFDVTGISQIATAEELGVTVEGGSIVVDNAKGLITVYDMSGAMVRSGNANGGRTEITVPGHGIYIVKTGNKAVKVSL